MSTLRFSSLPVVAGLALFLSMGCGKSKSTGTSSGAPPESEPSTITSLDKIASSADKRTLVGKKVDIASAPVRSVVGTYTFWAGDPHSGVAIVRMDRLAGPVAEHVRAGGRVSITGTVRLLESTSSTDPMWDHVNENERRDIMNSVVYVAADKVKVIH